MAYSALPYYKEAMNYEFLLCDLCIIVNLHANKQLIMVYLHLKCECYVKCSNVMFRLNIIYKLQYIYKKDAFSRGKKINLWWDLS